MIIAIDGPAGSGKSTVAKQLAQALDFHYLDTGAMYRALACRAADLSVALDDESSLAHIAATDRVEFAHEPGEALPSLVSIAGVDVTEAIRTPAIDEAVSAVARLPRVREAMVAQQRELAHAGDVVVEGRDIGSVVFPDAELKVFLTASPEERARRRAAQQSDAGIAADANAVQEALVRRDEADSKRDHSPLTRASGAVEIDTTGMTLEQVIDQIAGLARELHG
ncbi:MAG: (d)CMP kinase [Coriobacteriia bacterium]|nr:(d)CMP kinase [Coriobacteriia bacterium]